jgi:hypothetical protein
MTDNDANKAAAAELRLISISDTMLLEYLDVVRNEYDVERDKKQGFESRAGMLLTLLAAIAVYTVNEVPLKDIISLVNEQLTFWLVAAIVSGFLVYVVLIVSVIMLVKIIKIRAHAAIEIKDIDVDLLNEQKIPALHSLIFTYRDIVQQHRELNAERAKYFTRTLNSILSLLVLVFVYITSK